MKRNLKIVLYIVRNLKKVSIFETNSKPLKKDSSAADNHFESDLGSYEIFLRVSIFETKWFGRTRFSFQCTFMSP
jgi:hypothetical protein